MKNRFYPIVLILLFILGIGLFILPQNKFSTLENRYLSTSSSIKSVPLTDDFDSVMKDQFYFRDSFSKFYYTIKTKINYLVNGNEEVSFLDDDVIDIGDGYLVNSYMKYSEAEISSAENRGYNINEVDLKYPDIKTYVYMPTRYEEIMNIGDIENYLDDMRNGFICQLNSSITYSSLNYDSINKYKDFFYKSDFHWNIKGSYQGYKDIIEMIGQDFSIDEPKQINETISFDYEFLGNVSNKIGKTTESDNVNDYTLSNIADFDYYENNELKEYGSGKIEYEENGAKGAETDYDSYFGPYTFKRIFDFHDDSKPNILIFGDSYINPIQLWLASHFNKTVVIDLRSNDGSFSLDQIIKENDIDVILVCEMYYNLYVNGNMFIPLN